MATTTTTTTSATPLSHSNPPPSLVIVVGTYDGVLAGWQQQQQHESVESDKMICKDDHHHDPMGSPLGLELSFATPVHQGSIRSLCLASSSSTTSSTTNTTTSTTCYPGTILSCGYDETLKTHDYRRHITCSGEITTPADFGTPTCASFAPPPSLSSSNQSTHCLVGFAHGKLVVYKKRDWSIQHVLTGHDGGIASLAVHPSGKLALTGGQSDGKLKLWDLVRGRLSYATKVVSGSGGGGSSSSTSSSRATSIDCLEFSLDGTMYGWCCGNHVTVRATDSGKDLLNVDLPSRANQITLLQGDQGVFVAVACNDGSLPVLAVHTIISSQDDDQPEERRAILAIEPVENNNNNAIAGEERFKCIQRLNGYRVVTANSAGVVSIMDLQGAVNMITTTDIRNEEADGDGNERSDSDNDQEGEELAVDIKESVRLGSGARITCLVAWYRDADLTLGVPNHDDDEEEEEEDEEMAVAVVDDDPSKRQASKETKGAKRKVGEIEMDSSTVKKARNLVRQANKLKKRKARKQKRKQAIE